MYLYFAFVYVPTNGTYVHAKKVDIQVSWQETYDKGNEIYNQGDYKNTAIYYKDAIPSAEKEFGKEHPSYATSLSSLASLYHKQGLYAKAEPLT